MQITVSIKSVYGNELIYPECDTSKLLAELTGKKTLTRQALATIKKMGYAVEVLPQALGRMMTRDEVIQFGKRKYGKKWIARLAADMGYSISSVMRVATGETPEVSRRMELEMERLVRRHRFEALARPEVRYEEQKHG